MSRRYLQSSILQNCYTNVWLYDEANLEIIEEVVLKIRNELSAHPQSLLRDIEIGVDLTTDDHEQATPGDMLGCYYVVDKAQEEVFWLHEVPCSFYCDGDELKIISREHLRESHGLG